MMTDTSRIEAQQRADEIRIFRKELDRLESEGVLLGASGNDIISVALAQTGILRTCANPVMRFAFYKIIGIQISR